MRHQGTKKCLPSSPLTPDITKFMNRKGLNHSNSHLKKPYNFLSQNRVFPARKTDFDEDSFMMDSSSSEAENEDISNILVKQPIKSIIPDNVPNFFLESIDDQSEENQEESIIIIRNGQNKIVKLIPLPNSDSDLSFLEYQILEIKML